MGKMGRGWFCLVMDEGRDITGQVSGNSWNARTTGDAYGVPDSSIFYRITIEYKHYGVKYRTIDARTGSIISENY